MRPRETHHRFAANLATVLFYRIEPRLSELGFGRAPGPSLTRSLGGAMAAVPSAMTTSPLRPRLIPHYPHRLDPAGLAAAQRQQLPEEAGA